jgi:hypothetical protein
MPQTTRTTVNQNQNGQYQTTIPKALGDALDLNGKYIEWNVSSGSALEVRIVDE